MTARVILAWCGLAGGLGLCPSRGVGQSLAVRIAATADGPAHMTFAARAGSCGDGWQGAARQEHDAPRVVDCETGPVHVIVIKESGDVVGIRWCLGGRWRASDGQGTDLGEVSALEAAAYLIEVARGGDEPASRQAIVPAALADSAVVWPDLLEIAKDATRASRTRREALRWTAIAASRALEKTRRTAIREDPDRRARQSAVFALSRLPAREGTPRLAEIAREHRFVHVRQAAIFWLGESGDPLAVEVIEEVLRGAR